MECVWWCGVACSHRVIVVRMLPLDICRGEPAGCLESLTRGSGFGREEVYKQARRVHAEIGYVVDHRKSSHKQLTYNRVKPQQVAARHDR